MHPISRPLSLEAAFLGNRDRLLRFLAARGAGDAAEDVLQELWLRLSRVDDPDRAAQPGYMMRAADRLMVDRYRSARQARQRERRWTDLQPGTDDGISPAPDAGRILEGREHARLVGEALDELGDRPAAIFRRHRIDGIPQRQIAEEFSISLSTVENDLRRAYRALSEVKRLIDEV